MAVVQFSRQQVSFDDGWSRCPHGIYRLREITVLDKIVLLYLWSQTDAYLAKLTVNIIRDECGSSSVVDSLNRIVAAGFAVRHAGGFRGAHSFELLAEPWLALFGPHPKRPVRNRIGDQSEIGSVTSPKSDSLEEEREDQVEDQSKPPCESVDSRELVMTQIRGDSTRASAADFAENQITAKVDPPPLSPPVLAGGQEALEGFGLPGPPPKALRQPAAKPGGSRKGSVSSTAGQVAKVALDRWCAKYGELHVTVRPGGGVQPARPFPLRTQGTDKEAHTRWVIAMRQVKTVVEAAFAEGLLADPALTPFGVEAAVRSAGVDVGDALLKADSVMPSMVMTRLRQVVAANTVKPVEDRGFGVSDQERQQRERLAGARKAGLPLVTGI